MKFPFSHRRNLKCIHLFIVALIITNFFFLKNIGTVSKAKKDQLDNTSAGQEYFKTSTIAVNHENIRPLPLYITE